MSTRLMFAAALCAALTLAACSKQEQAPAAEPTEQTEDLEPTEPAEAEEEAAEEPMAETNAPGPETVPIPEDYAAEAAQEVTADNYQQQLAAMEKELGAE